MASVLDVVAEGDEGRRPRRLMFSVLHVLGGVLLTP